MKKALMVIMLICSSGAYAQTEDDAAHRADHRRTEALNRRAAAAIAGRESAAATRTPNADTQAVWQDRDYQDDQDRYKAARARYAQELANWHRRVEACRDGDWDACN